MTRFTLISTVLGALASIASASIPTVSVTGAKFFTSDGYQFYIKGVAYQLVEFDPLVDTEQCARDADMMQKLGANSIRVYHVNATEDHTGCMNAFAAKGIYVWVDLDSFTTYLSYSGNSSWTTEKSDSYRAVMDNFQQYDNTAGFFVGNEIIGSQEDAGVAPYLLAAKVDLAAYSKAKGYRDIPIGYSSADILSLRPFLQDYLACRPDASERLDFFALNTYEWCGETTFSDSGYDELQSSALDYPIPIYVSETGCNNVRPRTFQDMNSLLGPDMADTWSGAIVYEWIQEWNDFGLVSYGMGQGPTSNDSTRLTSGYLTSGTPSPVAPDFQNLQDVWATLNPVGVNSAQYKASFTATPKACPESSASGWALDPSATLPTLGKEALQGVTTGLPSGIPTGSITVTYSLTHNETAGAYTSASTGYSLVSASATASGTSQGAGARSARVPSLSHVYGSENSVFQAFTTIAGITVIAMLWL